MTPTNKYLAAFRDRDKSYFVTDCAFSDFLEAVCYAARVLQVTNTQTVEARILDNEAKKLVLQMTHGDEVKP